MSGSGSRNLWVVGESRLSSATSWPPTAAAGCGREHGHTI
jgi:hypothetical protein